MIIINIDSHGKYYPYFSDAIKLKGETVYLTKPKLQSNCCLYGNPDQGPHPQVHSSTEVLKGCRAKQPGELGKRGDTYPMISRICGT